jgi:hypothetical protein
MVAARGAKKGAQKVAAGNALAFKKGITVLISHEKFTTVLTRESQLATLRGALKATWTEAGASSNRGDSPAA